MDSVEMVTEDGVDLLVDVALDFDGGSRSPALTKQPILVNTSLDIRIQEVTAWIVP